MNEIHRRIRVVVSLLCALTCAALPAHAQEGPYPSRTITALWPYSSLSPGTEPVIRLMFDAIAQKYGTSYAIEPRGGANGAIAMAAVAKAKPDGYTLVLSNVSPTSVLPFAQKELGYDAAKDFQPVILWAYGESFILAGPTVKAANFGEVLAQAKANPGKVTYSVFGAAGRLQLAKLQAISGASFLQVPFKGPGEASAAVAGGHVDLLTDGGDVKSVTKGGALRILVTNNPARSRHSPDIPSVSEFVPGYSSRAWHGILAPAGTPRARIDLLYREMSAVLAQPKTRELMSKLGLDPVDSGGGPDDFLAMIQAELRANAAAAKQFNIVPQ
jgi:tripartite-type tricarboxylate transporter receptor subunit TctC